MIKKRIFDLFFTIPGIIIVLPVLVLSAFWIKLDTDGPIFFRQERVGRNGKLFKIYKFRTMVSNAESIGEKVTIGCDSRITQSGSFLRKFKLDELPQLINVLFGEMSLVGPRPEVPEYVMYWPSEIRDLILSIPPGITDFASLEFRNENDLLEGCTDPVEKYIKEITPVKLEYYLKYVTKRSVLVDFWLILRTISTVFR